MTGKFMMDFLQMDATPAGFFHHNNGFLDGKVRFLWVLRELFH
jgi:hypothetical protein